MKQKKSSSTIGAWIAIIVIIIVVFGLVGTSIFQSYQPASPTANIDSSSKDLPGLQTGNAPWAPELDHLKERLTAIDLPALAQEGTTLHIHQHLDILVDGKPVAVPAGIGINEAQGFISPIH